MQTVREKLFASATRAILHVRDKEARVGNSRKITLDDEVVDKYGISKIARLDKDGDQYSAHAGPTRLDRTAWWTVKVDDHVQDVEDLIKGKKVDLGRERRDPKVIYQSEGSGVPHAYECQLLTKLASETLTLVNPAKGTLFRAKSREPIYVLLTNNIIERRKEVVEIGRKEKQDFEFVKEVRGMAYLGSNGVQDVRPEKWCCLIPNPYIRPFPYENYSIKKTDFGVVMEYTRKERTVTAVLRDVPQSYRYSPDQVDRLFYYSPAGKITCGHYFFETSEELEGVGRSEGVLEGALYLPKYVDNGDGASEDSEYVYDVPGDDTYLSRYRRVIDYAKTVGKIPVPLTVSNNKFTVSFCSHKPERSLVSMITSDPVYTIINLNNQYYPGPVHGETYTYVYSPQLARTSTPLPEGGEEKIPFCPATKRYKFDPVIPGVYFVLPFGSRSQDFFFSILTELYTKSLPTYRLEPKIKAAFHHDYLNRQAKVIQLLVSRPEVEMWDSGGIGEIEIAQHFHISAKAVFPLTRFVQGIYWYPANGKNGPEMHYGHLSRVRERVGKKTYAELLMDWYLTARAEVSLHEIDRVTAFLRVQGLSVVKTKYIGDYAEIEGVIDVHARRRLFG